MTREMMLADIHYWSGEAARLARIRDDLNWEIDHLRDERCGLLEKIARMGASADPDDDPAISYYHQWMDMIATELPETQVQSTLRSRIRYMLTEIQRLRGASAHPPDEGRTARDISLLYFAALERFQEAARGDHDGICSGAGCDKCFLTGVQPLLSALRVGAPEEPR